MPSSLTALKVSVQFSSHFLFTELIRRQKSKPKSLVKKVSLTRIIIEDGSPLLSILPMEHQNPFIALVNGTGFHNGLRHLHVWLALDFYEENIAFRASSPHPNHKIGVEVVF